MKKDTLLKNREMGKDARRKLIVDAAEAEFAEKSLNDVSMRDIARRAGISPALIYRYFPDQQSLFFESFMRGVVAIVKNLSENVDETADDAIRQAADEFIRFFTVNDQYFRMMVNFIFDARVEDEFFNKLIVVEQSVLNYFDLIIGKLNLPGETRLYSHVLFSALVGIVVTFRNNPAKNSDDIMAHRRRIADILAGLFLSLVSCGTDKGGMSDHSK